MTDCPHADVVSALVDGECGPEERRALHDHLQECPPCRRLMKEFSAVRGLVSGLERKVAPEALVRRALRPSRRAVDLVRSALAGRRRYAAVAAAGLSVLVTLGGLAAPAEETEPPVDVFVARHQSVSTGNHVTGDVIFAVTGR